jgi:hypothetical protein
MATKSLHDILGHDGNANSQQQAGQQSVPTQVAEPSKTANVLQPPKVDTSTNGVAEMGKSLAANTTVPTAPATAAANNGSPSTSGSSPAPVAQSTVIAPTASTSQTASPKLGALDKGSVTDHLARAGMTGVNVDNGVAVSGDSPVNIEKARLTYADMYKLANQYSELTPEEKEKEEKRRKREQLFAAIGDGISGLANLYFTTQGGLHSFDGSHTQSQQVENRWQALIADREAKRKAYLDGLLRAQQADDERADKERAWKRQLGLDKYKQDKDAADDAYKKGRDAAKDKQWQESFDQKKEQLGRAAGQKDAQLAEQKRANKAKEGLLGRQIGETARHNRVMEGHGAARIVNQKRQFEINHGDGKGKNGSKGYTIRLNDGSVHEYDPKQTGAINSLAPTMAKKAMAAAQRYRKAGDPDSEAHYKAIAEKIDKAKSDKELTSIVTSNVGDFPTMDSDIRRVIGAPENKNWASGLKF